MFINVTQPKAALQKPQTVVKKRLQPKDYEEHMTWRIRWYIIIAVTFIYVLFLFIGLLAYMTSKDLHYLFFLTPTALIPFVYYLVPMDQKRYELKKLKIQAKAQLQAQKQKKEKQIP